MFKIIAENNNARAGVITLNGKQLETPAFLPVASRATIKTITPNEAKQAGCKAIIVNALHLYRRAFDIASAVNIHNFMGWDGLIFTDSGGFQTIKKFPARVTNDGIFFNMPDGKEELFTPEISVDVQHRLGSDFTFSLDDCPPFPATRDRVLDSLERTIKWAYRCQGSQHFLILQGGIYEDLRSHCAEALMHLEYYGYALGGLCIGEPKSKMFRMVETTTKILPKDKPRHLMGVGSPDDIITCVQQGIDIFDSAFPTRNARHGTIFTNKGNINLGRQKVKGDAIDEQCSCYVCRTFSLDYLNYLFKEKEPLGMRLATIHNLSFIQQLMVSIREELI